MENEKPLYQIKNVNQLDDSPIEWLIPDWIPKRGLTFIFGDGGVGKSSAWVSIVSALSKGNRTILHSKPVQNEPIRTLCFSGEDAENVLKKRFTNANANGDNIIVFAQDTESPDITFESKALKDIVDIVKPELLIFDPLQAYLPSNVDMSRRNQMRQALKPLQALSKEYDMPVIIVCHSNKRAVIDSGRDKMSDSSDTWDVARSVIAVGFTEDRQHFISLEKSNYSDLFSVPSILFDMENGRLVKQGETDKKMGDFAKERRTNRTVETAKPPTQKELCQDAILEYLSQRNNISAAELDKVLSDKDFGIKTIRSSKKALKDEGYITGNKQSNGDYIYSLAEDI